jgi:uncharacterized short protein YbdD (DUF466 family)
MYFTEKEEEFVKLLIEIGTKKNVAKILVFLVNIPALLTLHGMDNFLLQRNVTHPQQVNKTKKNFSRYFFEIFSCGAVLF